MKTDSGKETIKRNTDTLPSYLPKTAASDKEGSGVKITGDMATIQVDPTKKSSQIEPIKPSYQYDEREVNTLKIPGDQTTNNYKREGNKVETLGTKKLSQPKNTKPTFIKAEWDRYEFVDFLGEGGMGSVYKAKDKRLDRYVALKFLRSIDADLMSRFAQEAQAQARVDNKYICKVYEVGEVEGHEYIAMQYIDGPSLKDGKEKLTIAQKIKIIQQVSEGLHAAHRIGLIHRDIKPANIMLEQAEDGSWVPYVMDFGLARDVESQGNTVTGMIMGTPAYMSPEQALGLNRQMDRRSDIYSIGATLYELLADTTPFTGTTGIELILRVAVEDAPSIRKVNPNISPDLETIISKCLDREVSRRYDSAKALAEDLQRYLDGEPIKARRASLSYILSKKAKKHKVAATTIAIAFTITIILSGMGLRAWWNSAEQARIAQKFGQQVEKIEAIINYANMLPLHDNRPEKQLIRERMQSLETEMSRIGRVAQGPGNYALGNGYLALEEYEHAAEYLNKAWQSNYRNSEVAYSLGLALAHIYMIRVQAAQQQIGDAEQRAARIIELQKNYREPALGYLNSAKSGYAFSPYADALIAFCEGKYDEALVQAKNASEKEPWLYQAKKMAGDIYLERARAKFDKGDYAAARADCEEVATFYRAAKEIARSNESIYSAEVDRYSLVMDIENFQGQDLKDSLTAASAIHVQALQIDANSPKVYQSMIKPYLLWAENQINRGQPATGLDSALEMAEKAMQLNPTNIDIYSQLINIYYRKVQYEVAKGLDPQPSFLKATEIFQKAQHLNISGQTYASVGLLYWRYGMYEMKQGSDPTEWLNQAIASFEKALEINKLVTTYNGLGNAYEIRGEYEMRQGHDPQVSLDQALKAYQQAQQLNPNYFAPYNNIGITYRSKARYQASSNIDPRKSYDFAAQSFLKGVSLKPVAESYKWLAENYVSKSDYEITQGLEPTKSLNDATEAINKGLAINANDFEVYIRQAQVAINAARWAMINKQNPQEAFTRAKSSLDKAIQLNSQAGAIYQTQALLYRYQTEWLIATGQSPKEIIQKGLATTVQALNINGQLDEALAQQGVFYLLESQFASEGQRNELRSSAKYALTKALQMNSLLKQSYQPYLERVN